VLCLSPLLAYLTLENIIDRRCDFIFTQKREPKNNKIKSTLQTN
jgi:hypothetical protein